MAKTPFAKSFAEWLERVGTGKKPPKSIVAYNIGLFETEDGFSAYCTGAESYDEDDSEWACEESLTPKERYFPIPAGTFKTWKQAHAGIVKITRDFLASEVGKRTFFSKAQAVAVGFDDGDLERVK